MPIRNQGYVVSLIQKLIMNLIGFIDKFPDEKACRAHFREQREKQGLKCRQCGHLNHYWISTEERWQCKKCSSKRNLRSGTVMESSNLPFRDWYIAMHLLTSTKKSFSALELQRQLGRKRYEPVWYMLHKLRAAMGKRDSRYRLKEFVELDEGFFESVSKKEDQPDDQAIKRGRGSDKQSKVLVMVESKPSQKKPKNKHRPARSCGHVKMIVVDDLKWDTVKPEIEATIESNSVVRTDGYSTYSKLKDIVNNHEAIIAPAKRASTVLPWVHTVIANAKRTLLGIHHMIGKAYMQNYLNELSWKMNRRFFADQLFDRIIVTALSDVWYRTQNQNILNSG